jgi:hypothetical protein
MVDELPTLERINGGKVIFNKTFKTNSFERDTFLSRMFGIFSEEIVRIWCLSDASHFTDLGRPTISEVQSDTRGSTLDFTLQSKSSGQIYVVEMKCELQYQSYKYLTLVSHEQLKHHEKNSFQRFLEIAKTPEQFRTTIKGKTVVVSGAILIWGSVTEDGRRSVLENTGIYEVLSVENIIYDLIQNENPEYRSFIEEKREWCNYLLDHLVGNLI